MMSLKKHIEEHESTYSFLSIILISGIFCGILLTRWLQPADIELLSQYLTSVPVETDDMRMFFSTQVVWNSLFIIVIYLLGMSLIGIPLISFVIFSKGAQLGFSCALFWHSYQIKGIVGIVMTLFPQILFDVIAYFLICRTAIEFSLSILYCLFYQKQLPMLNLLNRTLSDLIGSLLLILVAAFMKSTIVIYLMKIFAMI